MGDKGNAFGAGIAVDGVDEDAFREEVGQVAQDAEDLFMRIRIAGLYWRYCWEGIRSLPPFWQT